MKNSCVRFMVALTAMLCFSNQNLHADQVLAVGNTADAAIYLIDISSGSLDGVIGVAATVSGIAADDENQIYYYTNQTGLWSVPYQGGPSTFIGNFNGDQTDIFGLGYDESTDTLYGSINSGIYTVDTTNAQTTLVFDPPGDNLLSGLDFDRATDSLYVVDDDGSGANGNGIYRLDLDSGNYVDVINPYPSGLGDVDGLAANNGLIYLVEDGSTDLIHEVRLSDGQVLRTFVTPYGADGFNSAGAIANVLPGPPVNIPITGMEIPELSVIDTTMTDFMQVNAILTASVGIVRNEKVIYYRSFGWQDENASVPVAHNVVMRIASVTKPITAAAIRQLIADGFIGLNERVFTVNGQTGILDITPFGTPDPRLDQITVNHLLQHYGGWDRNAPGVGDLTYKELQIASEMNIASPPGRMATVSWIMGQPLQSTPGTTYAYSNIGYLLLGMIVEARTGMTLNEYFELEIFTPIGVVPDEVQLGRTFKSDQDVREPWYDNTGFQSSNVFYPIFSNDQIVDTPYGGWHHEARVGQGGQVASAYAMLKYLDVYQVNGSDIGGPRPAPGGWRWNHTGSLTGTNSIARQRGDGVNYVILFNRRPVAGSAYVSQLRTTFDTIFDNLTVWPTNDVTKGDANFDGQLNNLDIAPFVTKLTSGNSGNDSRCDINEDGVFNNLDISPFVNLLTGN